MVAQWLSHAFHCATSAAPSFAVSWCLLQAGVVQVAVGEGVQLLGGRAAAAAAAAVSVWHQWELELLELELGLGGQ